MNFLGIGPFEVALVAIIAVIVLGPERIPGVAVQLARAVRYMRGYANDATADIRKELEELTKEYDEMRKEFREFKAGAAKDVTSVADEIDRTLRAAQQQPKAAPTKAEQPIIEPGGEPPPKQPRSRDGSK